MFARFLYGQHRSVDFETLCHHIGDERAREWVLTPAHWKYTLCEFLKTETPSSPHNEVQKKQPQAPLPPPPPPPMTLSEELQRLFDATAVVADNDEDGNNDDDDDDGDDHEEEQEEKLSATTAASPEYDSKWFVPWIPQRNDAFLDLPMNVTRSWITVVWCRITGARLLLKQLTRNAYVNNRVTEQKVRRFIDAHVKCAQYLDALPYPVTDDAVDAAHLQTLYVPLGESHHPSDSSMVTVTYQTHTMKETPLQTIRRWYGHAGWTPEEVRGATGDSTAYIMEPDAETEWCPFDAPPLPVCDYSLYYAVVHVLNKCMERLVVLSNMKPTAAVMERRDALRLYYASWVELFYHCGTALSDAELLLPRNSQSSRVGGAVVYGDGPSAWELWGGSTNEGTRTFCAGDLPDTYHIIASIPLWGEQHTPPYDLGKIYQKALPIACQRRHMIRLVYKCCQRDPAFFSMFSRLVWVLLANLYPGDLATHETRISMRDLLRIKELTESQELLLQALVAKQAGIVPGAAAVQTDNSSNGGPLIMSTIFRMHILYMTDDMEHYKDQARRCNVDWDYTRTDTIKLASYIRDHHLFADDPFAPARMQLSKTVKSPNARVHRLRKKSLANSLADQCNEIFEKRILKSRQAHRKDVEKITQLMRNSDDVEAQAAFFEQTMIGRFRKDDNGISMSLRAEMQNALHLSELMYQKYTDVLRMPHKSAILNALVRMQPEERLTRPGFSVLQLAQYGGVSTYCVDMMCELVSVYHRKASPKEFKQCINNILLPHFLTVCYYFNMAALLDRISFVPLDARTVQDIDVAMTSRRNQLFPNQSVPPDIYNVTVSLCCERVCTRMDYGMYGDHRVAYDLEKQMYVCAHSKAQRQSNKKLNRQEAELGNDDDDDGDSNDDNDDNDDYDDDNDNYEKEKTVRNTSLLAEISTLFRTPDVVADAAAMKGRGLSHSVLMENRKQVRNERKASYKIPCGQPVLRIPLRGRALVWGNSLYSKAQYMHCPRCGAFHIYSYLGFSASEDGSYRCSECMSKELYMHPYHTCAFCQRVIPVLTASLVTDERCIEVMCVGENDVDGAILQRLYFCTTHYNVARKYAGYRSGVVKSDLWNVLRRYQEYHTFKKATNTHNFH